jgi:hypothetical protein
VKSTGEPAGVSAFVASVAIRYRNAGQRCVRYVVHRPAVCGRISPVMACGTLIHYRHLAVIPFGRAPSSGAVATDAVHGGGNVLGRLPGRGTSVMATGAIGGGSEESMVRLGAQPSGSGLVAALTQGLAGVDCRCGTGSQAVTRTHMAGGTLAVHRDVGVEYTGIPTSKTGAVAGIAIVDGYACKRCIGNVIGRPTICWRKCTGMAGRALPGYRNLAVIPFSGPPGTGAVAAHTIHGSRNMHPGFAGSCTAVVTGRAVGGRGEQAVVGLGADP